MPVRTLYAMSRLTELRRRTPRDLGLRLVVVPLLTLLLVWIWSLWTISDMRLGPNGITFDNTLATFLSSASVLQRHKNPYNPRLVCASERGILRAQSVPVDQPTWNCRVGNPPVLFWLLQPFIRAPYRLAGYVWLALIELASVVGFLGVLSALGWRKRFLPSLVFLLMPPVTYATYYGEIDGLVFGGVGAAWALARRNPFLAGALLVVAWLKVPIGLPVVLLMALFYVPGRLAFLRGFAVSTGLFAVLTLPAAGWISVVEWVRSLLAFSGDTAVRGHQASLVGLYVRWVPAPERLTLEAAGLLAAVALTAWYWAKRHGSGDSISSSAWLWLVWFLAVPYGQYYDELILAVPVLALVGRDGCNVTRPTSLVALYGIVFSVLLAFRTVHLVDPLSLPLVALALVLAWQSRRLRGSTIPAGLVLPAETSLVPADRAVGRR